MRWWRLHLPIDKFPDGDHHNKDHDGRDPRANRFPRHFHLSLLGQGIDALGQRKIEFS
jgi:hypothetical protein